MNKYIVLIRGLSKEAGHWGDLIPYLNELFPDYKTLALDISGTGKYINEKTPLCMDEVVLRMREDYLFAVDTDKKEEVILIAISLGGMVAASWLNSYPEDFTKAVLINTSFATLSPFYKRLQLSSLGILGKMMMTSSPELREELVLSLISNNEEKRELVLPLWVEIAKIRPVSRINVLRQLLLAWFNSPKVDWNHPTLILASKKDRMVSCECSQALSDKKGFPIIYHPEAGHALSVDDPKWIGDQISFWVKQKNEE